MSKQSTLLIVYFSQKPYFWAKLLKPNEMGELTKSAEATLGTPQDKKKGFGAFMKNVGKAGWQAVKQEANRQAKKFNRSAQNGTVAEDYGLNKPTNQQDSIPGQEQAQPGIVEQMGQKVIDAGIYGAINQANQTNTGRTISTVGSVLGGVVQIVQSKQDIQQPDTTITEEDMRQAELEFGHETTDSLKVDTLNNQATRNQVEIQRFQQQQQRQPEQTILHSFKR